MQTKFESMTIHLSEVQTLRTTISELSEQVKALQSQASRADSLEAEMKALKEEISHLKSTQAQLLSRYVGPRCVLTPFRSSWV